jgi:hypothetical protein
LFRNVSRYLFCLEMFRGTFYFPRIYFINLISKPCNCHWLYILRIEAGAGSFIFSQKNPYRLWGQITLPFSGYRSTILGIKPPGRDVYLLSSSIAEVKNEWSHNSAPLIRLHGIYKVKFISLQCL